MGLEPATGLLGLVGVLGFSMTPGVAFSGFTVGVALRSGSAGATQGAGFLFFPCPPDGDLRAAQPAHWVD